MDSFFQLKRSGDSNAIVLDDESDTTHSEDTVTNKKKRKFQPSWKTDYKWLEYDQENSKMFCSVCREFPNRKNVNYSLRIGTNNFQRDSLKANDESEGHYTSSKARSEKEKPREEWVLPAVMRKQDKDTLKKLGYLFDTAYYIAYLKLPFSVFPQLCSLQIKHGLPLGKTYMNDHACKDFCQQISKTQKAEQAMTIRHAKFISVMADGGTCMDVASLEEEIVYVRYVSFGVPKTFFVGLKEVESAKAPDILEAIKSVMDEKDRQWMQKLISTGTDDASVMLGRLGGVVALIQQEAPQVIGIHCVAHNLELAFADTLKSNSTMKEIKELLNGCWKHYQYSPKALRKLRELAEAMEVRVGKPTKADGTRWVPHLLRALKILLDKNFSVLVSHFEHTAEARDSSAIMQGRAKNVTKKLKSYNFLLHLYLMWDIVEELSKVSLIFQKNYVSVPQVKAELDRADAALQNMVTRPGKHLLSFQNEVGDGSVSKGVSLSRIESDDRTFAESKATIISDAKRFLQVRFGDFSSPVLSASGVISNHKSWPKERDELSLYGEDQLVTLAGHYQAVLQTNDFDLEVAKDQWLSLKLFTHNHRVIASLNQEQFWEEMFTRVHPHNLDLSQVLMIVEICLVMAVSSSCCERGFSCMGRLKSEYRNSLNVETVNMLMDICLNGPTRQEFIADKAVLHWFQDASANASRRPNLKDCQRLTVHSV